MKIVGKTLWHGEISETCKSEQRRVSATDPNTQQWACEFSMMMADAEGYSDAAALLDTGDAVLDIEQASPWLLKVRIREVKDMHSQPPR